MKSRLAILVALSLCAAAGRAQPTAITYQGVLRNGTNPVTGLYDLRFRLVDVFTNQVGNLLTNAPVAVTNGVFTVRPDFGVGIFDGAPRQLEIGVRLYGDPGGYAVLSPLQPVTSVPYAIQAFTASNAVALTAPLAVTNLAGTIPNSMLSPTVAVLTNPVVFSFSVTAAGFIGNAAGLTNLQATNLTGTIVDARLSTNVAFLTNPAVNFVGNVAATNFTGAGHGLTNVPGAFFWVTVSNPVTSMQPNTGYIATNDLTAPVLTLPASPTNGDVFKVAGVGAAGWIITQNAGQTVLSGNLSGSIGHNWRPLFSPANWNAVAASADGTKLAATVLGGAIWTSGDSGVSWASHTGSPLTSTLNWSAVASSADGTKLVATVGYSIYSSTSGALYTSANSGASWTSHTSPAPLSPSLAWSSVASSADGTKLVAVVHGGSIFVSGNSGGGWTAIPTNLLWTGVASSADGTKLVAVEGNGAIYTSVNSGANWQQRTNVGPAVLSAVVSSSDGVQLVATTAGGDIYVSPNSGTNWVLVKSITSQLTAAASSADGSRLVLTTGGPSAGATGSIFASADFGSSWIQQAAAPVGSWSDIVSSPDGSVLVGTVFGGNIYVSSQGSTTAGTTGYLIGPQHSAIELMYVGNNLFLPLSHEGSIRAY